MRLPLFPSLDIYGGTTNEQRAHDVQNAGSREINRNPGDQPGVSVVILNLNKPELIIPLVQQLFFQQDQFSKLGLNLQILIGDTGSTDPKVLAFYEAQKARIKVVSNLKYHFSKCNNQVAFDQADCEALLFLNNDVIFPADSSAILKMYQTLKASKDTGVVGLALYFPDGRAQHLGVDFCRIPEIYGFCFHPKAGEPIASESLPAVFASPAVTGACLMTTSQLYWKTAGMVESYEAECQDVDLCLTINRFGYYAQVVNGGQVVHLENGTRKKGEENLHDRRQFMRKWGSYIEAKFL